MGAIQVHEFMSLDGVIDTPMWTAEYGFLPRMGEIIEGVMSRSSGILLGRTTYEIFEQGWSNRTVEDDPAAPFFNDTTKYVVSSSLTDLTRRNSTVTGRYDAAMIRQLQNDVDGDLYVSGSGTLVRAMLADGLVDEFHLFMYPLTRGTGPRLFAADAKTCHHDPCRMRAVRQRRHVPQLSTHEVKPRVGTVPVNGTEIYFENHGRPSGSVPKSPCEAISQTPTSARSGTEEV